MSKELPFYGEKITFSDEMIRYNDLRSNFVKLGQLEELKMKNLIEKLKKSYKENEDFIAYIESLIKQIDSTVSNALDFSIYTLMYYGIDFYSKEEFISEIGDIETAEFYDKLGVKEPLEEAFELCDTIESVISDIADIRAEQRNGRSQYVNLFSTNLGGAVSGEITAGIMNMGLNAVRGLKDAWTDAGDKAEIKKGIDAVILEDEFLNKFTNAVMNPCLKCFDQTSCILRDNDKIDYPFSLEFLLEYGTVMKKIRNYAEYGNKEVARKMVKEQLQLNPYDLELYMMMYALCGDSSSDLIRLAKYFDMDSDYKKAIADKVKSEDYFESTDLAAAIAEAEEKLKNYKQKYLR